MEVKGDDDDQHFLPFQELDHVPFGDSGRIAAFVESPIAPVRRAIELLEIKQNDFVYDVGCGSGTFLIEMARQLSLRGAGTLSRLYLTSR